MGSACVFFSISPTRALLSDINAELVGMFEAVRQTPEAVYASLLSIPVGAESYYIIRKIDPNSLASTDRAARFIFLNRYCFNGLYRTNLKGEFNVPYASSKTGGLPTWDAFVLAANMLKNVDIKCGDFASILANEVKADDFIYLDPPYAVQNERIFSQYGPQTFGLNDLERLRDTLIQIDSIGAKFLLSYANSQEAKLYFRDWHNTTVEVQRNIAGFAKHRRRASEVLVSNFDCESLANFRNDQP